MIAASIRTTGSALVRTALAVVLAAPLLARDTGWVLQGEGGLVTALVLEPSAPSVLFASTARGIYKTRDGGRSWRSSGDGLEGRSVLSLAIDPRRPEILFATTDTGGVFRSVDGGEHWGPANTGLTARYVGAIAVDPHAPSTVYAGASRAVSSRAPTAATVGWSRRLRSRTFA